ncbi:YDG domain-containing protein [Selenomonas sp. oral taxon 149]|uniref:YDG domain-containing protein n=1 Tax=Selenomonas sp. oral taxon 149 TaxID=712535 RepID=UPI0001E097DE|nr:YDG domain-containing protein [Selenomonas sp. oral taxon 149]EFM22399.1 filamentous hemeagglutinin family domain protein [Selenomonas sp. oral taxon 149 str. 67H29BP]
MGKYRTRELTQRVRYAIIAGMAGAFLIPQVGFAAPTGGSVVSKNTDNTVNATITQVGNDTNIVSVGSNPNKVIEWRDYSIASGERVRYDYDVNTNNVTQTNNYLNIVTGANTSNINGKIEGGKNVYIVNPNGVIFGKTASVNVGNLYVSTQDTSTVNTDADMANNVSPLSASAAGLSDVVNMGKITANTVEVHGKNIRFLNAANVHTTNPVVLHTDTANGGYAHIGYRGTVPTNYKVNPTTGNPAGVSPEYYQLVANKTEFQNIKNGLTKNYMLENDIDFLGGSITPIAGSGTTPFTGKFDGNFFKLQNFTITGGTYTAPFGQVSGSRIENVGVTGAMVTGDKTGNQDRWAGGLIGYASGTEIKNVYIKDSQVDGEAGKHGGIVGQTMANTTLDGVYSKARIGEGGAVIGTSGLGTVISNTYSDARKIAGTIGTELVYFIDPSNGTTVRNSYVTGTNPRLATNQSGLNQSIATNTYLVDTSTGLVTKFKEAGTIPVRHTTAASSYDGFDINNTGAPGATWRIYEGRTTPMLTAFMSGTATATYNYRYFKPDGTPKDGTGNTVKSNDGKDITAEYNSYYMKVVDGSTSNPTTAGTKANVSFGAGADTSRVSDYVNSSTKDYDRTNGIRNAGTKAILWSDQDGPNLRGVNVTITPRDVRLDSGTIKPKRMYNGKSDVTKAFRDALTSGSITSSGFTQEDRDAGTVQLDFNKPGKIFKARMVDSDGNDTRNVGTHNVKFSGEIGFTGTDKDNYTFDGSSLSNLTGTATITKAPLYLTIQKKTADDKIYDGTSVVKDSAMFQTSGSENIKLDKTKTGLTLAQINAGTPTMPDGAIMTGDDDTTRDNVALTNVGGPKYTDEAGVEQLHAGPHKLQYTNVGLTGNDAGNYELYYTPASGTKTAVTGGNVYLDGKIIPRQILRDDFNVYDKTTHAKVDAKKVYDGSDEYTPTSNVYLSSNAVTGGTTGLVERDRSHITFALTGGKGRFAQNDGTTYSKNVRDVEKLAYEVTGHTDDATNYRLSDYYIMDGMTKKDLGSTFRATGAGKITPKALTATVVNQHITKVYDAMDDQTDGNRNITRGDTLVTLDGFVTVNGVKESRTNTSTAKYATKNVVLDGSDNPTTQSVTYTASFDAGTGVEADNYTLGTEGVTPIATTKTLTGGYTGTIMPRGVTVKFANATKIYDGTAANTQITASDLDDGLNKAVLNADSLGVTNLNTTGVTSRYGDNKTAMTFAENRNAGSRTVEYAGLTNALGTNYKLDAKQYGDGTITRRRIDPSGFKVRKSDGSLADATKVYDGTDTYNLPSGAYLTGSSASGDTGIVSHDFGKVVFELKSNSPGHFTKDAAGANRTSHKSEATYIAYDVKAKTLDPTNNPLSNYTFGVAGSPRNLETVTDANPAQVTAGGSITPASLRAATQEISKVYDGLTAHTDGNRNPVKGDTVVSFTGWVVHDGTTEKRTNSSTAEYATKDVAYDGSGNVIKKSVTYTGQLTGQYADDYQIVDAGNHVISTANGSGAAKTVTMNAPITVADAGKITPRKLNIKMGDVSKTYDGTAGNTSATVTGFTDDPASSVLAAVLGVDNVTASRLTTKYQGMMSASPATATSTYGRGTTSFTANANASNGTQHDVQYTNMRTAFNNEFGANAGNYTVDETVYGKGTINRREITPNNFQVKDANGNVANATKVYDGTTTYTLENGWHLTPAAGPGTGVIPADYGKVVFRLNGDAQFADSSDNPTANVANATKVLYNVKAEGDAEKIKNYTLNGVNLESGAGKVSGGGSITRRVLELDLVQNSGIDKVYDGTTTLKNTATKNWNALRDSDSTGNVRYATGATAKDKLVTTDGTSFNITSNYMESGSADKNVKRSGGNIVDKDILYKVAINGNATNYSFKKGGTVTNAESGLELSATGKITPKDLSGAFKKITKVYDGTKTVDPTKVGFKTGTDGVISGDTVTLNSHSEAFQSENVNGDNTMQVIDGTPQKNWINYLNLSLGGAQAGNYTIASTAKGLGEITPYELNDGSITFTKRQAEKVYDGTRDVKWTDGSSTTTDQKKYITSATVTVGSAPAVDILGDLKLEEAKYDTKDVDGGSAANRVTYKLSYTGTNGNFSLGTGVTSFTTKGDGVITKKDVTATVRNPLSKTYDATTVVKNAAGNVITGSALNDQVSLSGLTGNDGATYTTTAVYADKNAGTGKTVNYTLAIDGANAGNYNLKYNGADNNGNFSTTNNTITKRKVDVTFAPVSKSYDGTPTNTSITPSVSAADASVLSQDNAARVSGTTITGLTGVTSQYGTGTTDGTFTPDANAGTNKSVQYAGIGTAMGTVFGANNYEFATNGYGKGTITKANINTSDIIFATTGAHKVYDGTKTVKYNGSGASDQVKNYITTATANLGGGHTADLRGDLEIDTAGTKYASSNAGTGIGVTYKFRLNNNNIEISGRNEFEMTDTGRIDRRVLTLDLAQKTGIDKIYDANANLVDTNTRHYDKFIDDDAKGNVTYASGTTNDNKLVRTANGAAVDDGASMTITANYANAGVADKNAGVNKDIAYNVRIGGAQGQNYTLSYNGTTANAETGLDLTGASGTIAKRKITLGFGDVSKPYDTTPNNNTKNITAVTAGNTDGRGAATLTADGITSASFDTTGIVSYYGAGTTDAAFQRNPNVVTDANGNVIPNGKDVQYSNLANTLAAQPYAANYEITNTAYGKGTIRKRTVTANDFTFNINNATKMYDGTPDVYWKDTVTGKSYKDMDHVKNYFSTSKLDLGGGNLVDINLNDIQLNSAKYNDYRVAHAAGVDYDVTINTQNFEFSGSRNRMIHHAGDKIEKRDLATKLPPHLIKEYDGEDTFTETNEIFANAMARANLTGVVDRDKNKIQLKVQGTYSSPDASVETRADAEARIPAQAGRNVHYDLTLSGDTDTLSNYKIGSVETLDANGEMKGNGSGKADIYKKTLTVSADPIDKVYDGTRTVVRPNGSTTAPHPAANKLKLNGFAKSADHFDFDQTAADKIDGLYSDPNVSRAADGTILDKDIAYSGVKAAFKNYADNHAGSAARNYRVDSDTVSGKGKITPRTITPNDIANGLTLADATKVYDGTRAVKHGGLNTPDALRNYLTSATVNINGTPIDIKNELTIRADEASTHYDTANVAGGAQPRVTYTLNYTGHNFDIADPITKTANGVITKRQVTAYAPGQLTKEYDGTTKVYDSGDPTIKTYYRGNQVTSGADIVQLEEENGDRGLLTNDGVQNISTATFEDKKAGRNKKVNYNIAVDAAHAGNYELVDQRGNVISQTSTNNNTITPRRLDITFGDVSREYNGTSTNTDVTALVKDSDARATLRRDGVNPSGEQLILRDAANNDITLPSDYGYGRTDSAFTKNADANQTGEPPKDVQYRKLGDAMRTLLGNDAGNYDFDETGYGKGRITKASVRESDFRMKFKDAVKEYDGTNAVNDARSRLDRSDSRMRLPRAEGWKPFALQDKDIADIKGTYQPTGGKRSKDASENSRGVQYEVQLSKQNFDFENGWDGKIRGDGAGKINRRAITAETLPYLTKEYDGTRGIVNAARDADGNLITQSGDGLMRFRHANDAAKRALITGDDVSNATTATYDTENVAWKDGVWNQGNGTTADVGVAYALGLSGADAANYKIVDSKGDEVTNAKGLGKIRPKEIVLKADPQERWINEGLPTSYTGTPQGTNLSHNEVPEIVPDEKLPGTIDYSSPNARLRVGHYAVNGTYHAPNDAKDGDAVSRNYRFIQDPANDTALYIGPYIPDYEYYKAMTQVSKMTPDEYAYENASLDRTNHYSRKPTAQVDPVPPSVNVMRDGKDITRSDINVLDDTVYTIVDEVFG